MLKKILLLFTVITFVKANSQHTSAKADAEIRDIDTLIKYNEFAKAERNTKALYRKLKSAENNEDYAEQFLELKFREALFIDRQYENPSDCLELLMRIVDDAEEHELHSLTCRIYLLIALEHEKTEKINLAGIYLDKARDIIAKNKLDDVYSTYCIRRSSYYRYMGEDKKSTYFALKAREYAKKYKNDHDLMDTYILLPPKTDEEFLATSFLRIKYYNKVRDYKFVAMNHAFIAEFYLDKKNYSIALKHSDSAYKYHSVMPVGLKYYLPELKSKIYEKLGRFDSAYYYHKEFFDDVESRKDHEQITNTKKLEEHYQNDKKEATIKNKDQQLFLIIILLTVTIGASFLLYRYNRKISRQNATINRQVMDLSRLLEQKQVLLSELQHRVKNNLQHVISILELQKESVGFNNIDELIRENQNRIHSMALLHRKLNVSDSINDIDLERYVTELSGLVVNSYEGRGKEVSLNVECDIETLSIEKALPLGLIIVELVSNSIKHAFKKQKTGIITIAIRHDTGLSKNVLYYADNGPGYDFGKVSSKGLGMEIIKGLIDQLDGQVTAAGSKGFELTVSFN